MSSDPSVPRPVWPWGKPLPHFTSLEEEETFWTTYDVEDPPEDVGEVVVSDQSQWLAPRRPLSWAGWAGVGGAIGAAIGSTFGLLGSAIGGGAGAGVAAYVLATRSHAASQFNRLNRSGRDTAGERVEPPLAQKE
jgi:hypothetical protein